MELRLVFPVLLIYGKFKQFVILRPKYCFFNDSHFAEACACIISRMNSELRFIRDCKMRGKTCTLHFSYDSLLLFWWFVIEWTSVGILRAGRCVVWSLPHAFKTRKLCMEDNTYKYFLSYRSIVNCVVIDIEIKSSIVASLRVRAISSRALCRSTGSF